MLKGRHLWGYYQRRPAATCACPGLQRWVGSNRRRCRPGRCSFQCFGPAGWGLKPPALPLCPGPLCHPETALLCRSPQKLAVGLQRSRTVMSGLIQKKEGRIFVMWRVSPWDGFTWLDRAAWQLVALASKICTSAPSENSRCGGQKQLECHSRSQNLERSNA